MFLLALLQGAELLTWDVAVKLAALIGILIPLFTLVGYLIRVCIQIMKFFAGLEDKIDELTKANIALCESLGVVVKNGRKGEES